MGSVEQPVHVQRSRTTRNERVNCWRGTWAGAEVELLRRALVRTEPKRRDSDGQRSRWPQGVLGWANQLTTCADLDYGVAPVPVAESMLDPPHSSPGGHRCADDPATHATPRRAWSSSRSQRQDVVEQSGAVHCRGPPLATVGEGFLHPQESRGWAARGWADSPRAFTAPATRLGAGWTISLDVLLSIWKGERRTPRSADRRRRRVQRRDRSAPASNCRRESAARRDPETPRR